MPAREFFDQPQLADAGHTIVVRVEIPTFGKPEQQLSTARAVARAIQVNFGSEAKVYLWVNDGVHEEWEGGLPVEAPS